MPRFLTALKALRQLGPRPLGLYARYQVRLRLGRLRFAPPTAPPGELRLPVLPLPDKDKLDACLDAAARVALLNEADGIVRGQVRLFGQRAPQPLRLAPPGPLVHWTEYELGRQPWGVEDVKSIWEPARFGWSITLARAYWLSGQERYPQAFWEHWEAFQAANPPYLGQNWASAQEAALRLAALVFAAGVFRASAHSTPARLQALGVSLAAHAARIPPSLEYARAQHNNHLLSEAAGLYTAARALPEHPDSPRWLQMGRRWFRHGVLTQFTPEGVYAQHSTNYQRLTLQLGIWMSALAHAQGETLSAEEIARLDAGTRWLLALLDPNSGCTPNLGPNDGAYILPLTSQPWGDYRPTLQTAAQAFSGRTVLPAGPWDEMSIWLPQPPREADPPTAPFSPPEPPIQPEPAVQKGSPLVLRGPHSWAYLRAEKFTTRPGHADQLHLDLWWRGINVAQDAGTYSYNAPPPWDNALAGTASHNTLSLQRLDQMTRAGRFLFLDWAQGWGLQRAPDAQDQQSAWAIHHGYLRCGLKHERFVLRQGDAWRVEDTIEPVRNRRRGDPDSSGPPTASLFWHLPDGEFRIKETRRGAVFAWLSPYGWVKLLLHPPAGTQAVFAVMRAGATLYSSPVDANSPLRLEATHTQGWVSPTYAEKLPALAVQMSVQVTRPLTLTSRWRFPSL